MKEEVVYLKVEYDPKRTTSTQIMQAIAEFEDVHGIERFDSRIKQLREFLALFLHDLEGENCGES